ncbi:hypothetical protein B0J11DRAFT_431748 [Dendryphion nanum]|uniref:U6 small nuclear RNA (adenine-(43)-N(6))-methyltransferase n=1 Tax=Dendryphion nanum TaxID=256645 RepID=A0A9P9IPE5_9PLEO|nr:hypothetical protein B0J11DRAFT_431748 [Dendryphion nanum]
MEIDVPSPPPPDLTILPSFSNIDFKHLASKDEAFSTLYASTSGHLDFRDPLTLTVLTKALLRTTFSLSLILPPDRLCPPIPNRTSYISFLHALLDSTSPTYVPSPSRPITGLDIGTGASAIYALLALRSRPNWHMCITDTDTLSFSYALKNLTQNALLPRTTALQTQPSDPLIPLSLLNHATLDFVMCNPPFFSTEPEMHISLSSSEKSHPANSICTGSASEMICPGGDLGFATRIFSESLLLREKVTWYTCLFGKLASARAIVAMLRDSGVSNWAARCIGHGHGQTGTRRWIVAWSFGDLRPSDEVVRGEGTQGGLGGFPTRYKISVPRDGDSVGVERAKQEVATKIYEKMDALDITWSWDMETFAGIGEARGNVWNRQYRRSRMKEKSGGKDETGDVKREDDGAHELVALAFRITVSGEGTEITIEWLRGTDVSLWESFCGMLHRVFR